MKKNDLEYKLQINAEIEDFLTWRETMKREDMEFKLQMDAKLDFLKWIDEYFKSINFNIIFDSEENKYRTVDILKGSTNIDGFVTLGTPKRLFLTTKENIKDAESFLNGILIRYQRTLVEISVNAKMEMYNKYFAKENLDTKKLNSNNNFDYIIIDSEKYDELQEKITSVDVGLRLTFITSISSIKILKDPNIEDLTGFDTEKFVFIDVEKEKRLIGMFSSNIFFNIEFKNEFKYNLCKDYLNLLINI